MRILIPIIIALLCCGVMSAVAQDKGMRIITIDDTNKVPALLNQANKLMKTFPDSAILLSEQALDISKNANNRSAIVNSLLSLGAVFFQNDEYFKSKAVYQELIPYSYYESVKNKLLYPLIFNNLANIYLKQGYIDSAVHYYYKSLSNIKSNDTQDLNMKTLVYSNLGAALAAGEQNEQALYYLQKGYSMSMVLKDDNLSAQNILNMGFIYKNRKESDSAIRHYYSALSRYKKLKDIKNLQLAYYYIGEVYELEEDIGKAKIYYDSAMSVDKVRAEKNAGLQIRYGNIQKELGNYRTAIPYLEKALNLINRQGIFLGKPIALYALAECYYHLGDNEKAYRYQKEYADLKDSILDEEKIATINRLEVKYRTIEQEKEITAQNLLISQQEKALLQKNTWIAGFSIGLLLLLSFLFILYRNNRHKHMLQNAKISALQQKQEIEQLRALMQGEERERNRIAQELHDGIGSLIAAARMHLDVFKTPESLPHDAASYKNGLSLLDEAYQDLRHTAHNLLSEQLFESGFANGIQAYCDRITKKDIFNVRFQTFGRIPDLNAEKALSLYRIIQELVHNASKHGEAKEVIVEMGADDQQLSINIEDNGKGWEVTEDLNQGIGVKNLRHRIKVLGGKMEIDSRLGIGTTIYITFDLGQIAYHR